MQSAICLSANYTFFNAFFYIYSFKIKAYCFISMTYLKHMMLWGIVYGLNIVVKRKTTILHTYISVIYKKVSGMSRKAWSSSGTTSAMLAACVDTVGDGDNDLEVWQCQTVNYKITVFVLDFFHTQAIWFHNSLHLGV